MAEFLTCPFCGENDFDKFGLKQHLIKWCLEFTEVELIELLRIQKFKENIEKKEKAPDVPILD